MVCKKTLLFLTFIFLLFSNSIMAQNAKGKVRFYTKMKVSTIKLDGKEVKYGEWIELDTGKHIVTAEATGHFKATEEFILKEGALKTVPIQMEPTEELLAHWAVERKAKRKKMLLNSGPVLLYSLYGGYALTNILLLNRDAQNNLDQAEKARQLHSSSFWLNDINKYRDEFESSKTAYNQNLKDIRSQWGVFAGVTAVAAGVIYFTKKSADKIEIPTFSEKSKLTHISVSPILLNNRSGLYLSYKF